MECNLTDWDCCPFSQALIVELFVVSWCEVSVPHFVVYIDPVQSTNFPRRTFCQTYGGGWGFEVKVPR